MDIVRDNEMGGMLMIPLWNKYNLHRCNVRNCKHKQTTLVLGFEAPFALCEAHYKHWKHIGYIECTLDFD